MSGARIAVLAGGLSLEREVSLRSGRRVTEALADNGHDVTLLDLDDQLVTTLDEEPFDAVFLTLHGKAGEDGTIQGLLELLELPYTGPDTIASALAWDKAIFKGLLRRGGLPTPEWVAISAEALRDMGAAPSLGRISDRLGVPLVVKPSQGGASMGVRYIDASADLPAALVSSYSYHHVVVVERFIPGTEVAVSIIDGVCLPAVEIVPKAGAYDFSARYTHGATEYYAPARLPDAVLDRCAEVALATYRRIGCRHVARADMIVDADGHPWLLELDTCPGMTETSLLPIAAEAGSWSFPELCERLLRLALEP